jgi:chromodomain-helicase-DNA-binding protein 7
VKYHNISFNHCEWLDGDTVQSLIASDRPLRTRFNNFIRKKEAGIEIPEAELVRSVPERIVDCSDPFRALYPTKAADVTRHEWTVYCLKIVDALVCCSRDHRCYGIPFLRPVDEEKDGAPGYYDIVKSPMDFITVQTKLYLRRYASPQEFWADVKKIFSNCLQYNSPRTEIAICCRYLEALFDKLYHEWACLSRANQDEAETVTKEKDLPYVESNDPNLTLQTAIQHISFYKQLKNTERTILYLVKWKVLKRFF